MDLSHGIAASRAPEPPLVVDLDGTLIAGDTLFESALLLARQRPWTVFCFPFWLLRGKAALKANIAGLAPFRPEALPYRSDVIEFLREERRAGRKIVLATAAHRDIADAVAQHLGVFDEVIASDAQTNCKGLRKRDVLVSRFGARGFDYLGDSRADIPVWQASRAAHLVGRGYAALAEAGGAIVGKVFSLPRGGLRAWIRALRCFRWAKNLVVFIPLALAHRRDLEDIRASLAVFAAFCMLASGTDIANDLFDLSADRLHATKRRRPFASGELSIPEGCCAAILLVGGAFSVAAPVGAPAAGCLLVYCAVSVAYSLFFKHKAIIDVVILAFLYTLRLIAGGVAARVFLSH